MKEFVASTDAISYAEKKWKAFFDSLPKAIRNNVLSIQSRGRTSNEPADEKVINALYETIRIIPPFEEDIVLYRGGKEEDFSTERPFLSASFLKQTAERFSKNGELYRIIVRKGARAIPDCGMGIDGCGPEEEVILETSKIHRNGCECEYYEKTGYYKLYQLMDEKLRSNFGEQKPIEIGQEYSAKGSYNICFAPISNILDYSDEFGKIVCDILPMDVVTDSLPEFSKVESECRCVIALNPRSIYSPSFIREIADNTTNEGTWQHFSDEQFVIEAIEHCNDGKCYQFSLNYDLSETLFLLLLYDYPSQRKLADYYFDYRRKNQFDYNIFYNQAKKKKANRKAKRVIIEAWNKYRPCLKSKILDVFINS